MVIARAILGRHKHSPEQRADSQKRKYVRRDAQSYDLLGIIDTGQIRSPSLGSSHALEDVVLTLPVKEVRRRSRHIPVLTDDNEPLRLGVWQCTQQDCIDHTEDRRVRADT